jgi:hypothetical protein
MRLSSRTKVRLYPEVKLNTPGSEPNTTAPCETRRLLKLAETKHVRIEAASVMFLAFRHGDLDVVNGDKLHRVRFLFGRT